MVKLSWGNPKVCHYLKIYYILYNISDGAQDKLLNGSTVVWTSGIATLASIWWVTSVLSNLLILFPLDLLFQAPVFFLNGSEIYD